MSGSQRVFIRSRTWKTCMTGHGAITSFTSVVKKWSAIVGRRRHAEIFRPASQAGGACGPTEHDDSGIEDFAPDIGRSPHAEEDKALPVGTGDGVQGAVRLVLRVRREKPLNRHQQA